MMAKRFCVQPTPGQAMREPYLTARIFLTVPTAEAGLLGVEAEADTPPPTTPEAALLAVVLGLGWKEGGSSWGHLRGWDSRWKL